MTTIEALVPEQRWQAIQPLLPTPAPRYGGRPRVDDRAALAGIVYQLRTGVPWRLLPSRQLGCGSPVTCWRRLRDWQRAGVWQRLHQVLLDQLGRDGQLDWSRASLDSFVRAKRGRANRPEPDRPRQAWVQVPPAGRDADRRRLNAAGRLPATSWGIRAAGVPDPGRSAALSSTSSTSTAPTGPG
jgi:transposase